MFPQKEISRRLCFDVQTFQFSYIAFSRLATKRNAATV